MASTIPTFIEAAIQHPMAMSFVNFTPTEPPEIRLAIVIDAESDEGIARRIGKID